MAQPAPNILTQIKTIISSKEIEPRKVSFTYSHLTLLNRSRSSWNRSSGPTTRRNPSATTRFTRHS